VIVQHDDPFLVERFVSVPDRPLFLLGALHLLLEFTPANSSQQPTACRALVRRFRASCFADSRVSFAGKWRHAAAERANVGPSGFRRNNTWRVSRRASSMYGPALPHSSVALSVSTNRSSAAWGRQRLSESVLACQSGKISKCELHLVEL